MSKWLIVYSSVTGNTKKIAEAMFKAAPEGSSIANIQDNPLIDSYAVIVVGFWVTRGGPDPLAQKFLSKIHDKTVILFQTHGAEPTSEHAITSLAKAAYLLGENCFILGTFSCQGKINPALLERRKTLTADNPHYHNEANLARWAKAANHPNSQDLQNAKDFVAKMQRKIAMRNKFYQEK